MPIFTRFPPQSALPNQQKALKNNDLNISGFYIIMTSYTCAIFLVKGKPRNFALVCQLIKKLHLCSNFLTLLQPSVIFQGGGIAIERPS